MDAKRLRRRAEVQGISALPSDCFPEPIKQSLELGPALAKLGESFPVFLDIAAEPSKQRDVQNREGDPGSDDGVGAGCVGGSVKSPARLLPHFLLLGTRQALPLLFSPHCEPSPGKT